ncbi:MAG: DnaJ domain-containing protein [Flammeovirgaceae bacterium]|nr:DnaJ domain-containing protein [Flammeovirgaceae bacterium]
MLSLLESGGFSFYLYNELKNYYFILGLTTNAQAFEIKQAYRKLALQFHPDRNHSKEAEAIFKEVNEAYEILGDPQNKFDYDRLLKGVAERTPHRDPRYRPRPPGSYSPPSKRKEMLETMRTYLRHAVFVSRMALLFSAILIADLTLPSDKQRKEVVKTQSRSEYRGSQSMQLELQDGDKISLNPQTASEFKRGSQIVIYTSALFAVPLILENETTHFKTKIPVSIYGNFIFIPLVLLITSLLGTFYWKGIEFRFNLGVVNFVLMLLSFIFLRIHSFKI